MPAQALGAFASPDASSGSGKRSVPGEDEGTPSHPIASANSVHYWYRGRDLLRLHHGGLCLWRTTAPALSCRDVTATDLLADEQTRFVLEQVGLRSPAGLGPHPRESKMALELEDQEEGHKEQQEEDDDDDDDNDNDDEDDDDEKAPAPSERSAHPFDLGKCVQWIAERIITDPGVLVQSMERIRDQWTLLDTEGRGAVSRAAVERFVWQAHHVGGGPLPSPPPQSVVDEADLVMLAAPDKSRLTFWDFAHTVLVANGVAALEVEALFRLLPPSMASLGRAPQA
jgi:hypothetical protein